MKDFKQEWLASFRCSGDREEGNRLLGKTIERGQIHDEMSGSSDFIDSGDEWGAQCFCLQRETI